MVPGVNGGGVSPLLIITLMNYEQFASRQHSIKGARPGGAAGATTSSESGSQPRSSPSRPPRQRRRDVFQPTDPELHIHTFLMNGEDEEGARSGDEEGKLKRGDDTSEASSTEPAGGGGGWGRQEGVNS